MRALVVFAMACLIASATVGAADVASTTRGPDRIALASAVSPRQALPADRSSTAGDASVEAFSRFLRLPLTFIGNESDVQTKYRFRGHTAGRAGYEVFFAPDEIVFVFYETNAAPDTGATVLQATALGAEVPSRQVLGSKGIVVALRFVDANPDVAIEPASPTGGTVYRIAGSGRDGRRAAEAMYGAIVYRELWPGIDLVIRGDEGRLKYDLAVAAGADAGRIRFAYAGVDGLSVDGGGSLRIATALGTITDAKPVSYQDADGQRTVVESRFELQPAAGPGQVYGFAIGDGYQAEKPLIIDPAVEYATLLGSLVRTLPTVDVNFVGDIAVNSDGEAFIAVPVLNPGKFPTTPGAFDPTFNGFIDVVVSKLSADGRRLVYSTFVGGINGEWPLTIAVDAEGNAHVAGETTSIDFPVTPGAFDESHNGGLDVFAFKLASDGSDLVYSTFIGGSGDDKPLDFALDGTGQLYLVGQTESANFPLTPGVIDRTVVGVDCFVTKLDAAGQHVIFSTFLGGSGWDRCNGVYVTEDDDVYLAGITSSPDFQTTTDAFDRILGGSFDAFVAKISGEGTFLDYSTLLGGDGFEWAFKLKVDAAGHAYVAGATGSTDFPTTPGAYDTSQNGGLDAFVTELDTDGSSLLFSTFIGGSADDYALSIGIDAAGNVYTGGTAASKNFPTTIDAYDRTLGGREDAYVAKLSPDGSRLLYSTLLGGKGGDRVLSLVLQDGKVFVVGQTDSSDFPTTPGVVNRTPAPTTRNVQNTFVAKLDVEIEGQLDGGGAFTVGQLGGLSVGWGYNLNGQLCLLPPVFYNKPRTLPFQYVSLVKAGMFHTIGLMSDGRVATCGANGRGQLGNGQVTDSRVPVFVSGLTDIVNIEDGGNHVLARSVGGTLYAWGDNQEGQLCAPADDLPHPLPQTIELAGIEQLAAGDHHSLFVDDAGLLYVCGSNLDGQLGLGADVRRVDAPTPVPGLPKLISVATGGEHTIMVAEDPAFGTRLYTMGRNEFGQLCLGDTVSRSTPTPTNITGVKAVTGEGPFSAILLDNGKVVTCGWSMFGGGTPTTLTGTPPIRSISAGHFHLHAIDENGDVWAMGANFSGQLGDKTTKERRKLVKIGNVSSGLQ